MIIQDFQVHEKNGWSIEEATLICGSSVSKVYYSVPQQFDRMICRLNADAFLVAFLPIAAYLNEDIKIIDRPTSKKLKQNIETLLLPAFRQMNCADRTIKIDSETTEQVTEGNKGATGISLGVDCFYTLLCEDGNKINYVLSLIDKQQWTTIDNRLLADEYSQKREMVASKLGKTYIPIVSNIASFYKELANLAFEQVHTFCHLSCSMFLMNGIHEYYSTGYSEKENSLDFSDTSHYDYLISSVIDYPCFKMYTSGEKRTRLQKTAFIADNELVMKYLDVCYHNREVNNKKIINCTMCRKCIRTASTLEVLRKLDRYHSVFDIDLYNKERVKNWGHIRYAAIIMRDVFAIEILQEAKSKSIRIPIGAWRFFFARGIGNQIKKLKK